MPNLFIIFSFILGAIIGSFLNVAALRYNTGMTLRGRSKCFSCGKNLEWHELIPVLSFFFQNGKCKTCKTKISWQYPVIEILGGVLFLLVFYFFPPVTIEASVFTILYLIITCLLIVITIYDIKHKIIPDAFVYPFIILSFAQLFVAPDLSFVIPSTMSLLAGPIIVAPFVLIFLISKGTWMGFGDIKLMLGIGWLLGLVPAISAITLAVWICLIVSAIWMYVVFKKVKEKYEIPFGPYLILGMYLVLFFNFKVFEFTLP